MNKKYVLSFCYGIRIGNKYLFIVYGISKIAVVKYVYSAECKFMLLLKAVSSQRDVVSFGAVNKTNADRESDVSCSYEHTYNCGKNTTIRF
jgi:hypothetical protein